MYSDLVLSIVKNKSDVITFWKLFNDYINELYQNASLGDEFDLEYFYSDEYRDAIEGLRIRQSNPLKICFIKKENIIIGFLMYVTYFDEGGKCLLMEYYMNPQNRGLGYGRAFYFIAEKYIQDEGAIYIELTPTNEVNEGFWTSVGFRKTTDMDEDNKYFYRKSLH